jgi:putative ABC transport system ATP-binding protein
MTLEMVNFSKSYGSKKIFENLTLSFETGKSYALVGTSGSGKTTLLNSLGRLEKMNSGNILLDDKDIWQISERQFFHDYLGYVFQSYSLLENKTVQQNLKLVNHHQTQIIETLEKVGLDATYLTAKIYELSGGQAQRVAIARMLLKPKKIILADEPTGALDEITGDEFITLLLNDVKEEHYVIIATHDPNVYERVDVVIDVTRIGEKI